MSLISLRRALAVALAACAAIVGSSTSAHAISITIDSIAKLPGDSPNGNVSGTGTGGGSRQSEWDSQVSVLNGGTSALDVLGASASGQTRYASTLGADSDAGAFGTATRDVTSAYRVVFSVNSADPNVFYDLKIDTGRFGALVVRDEGGANGEARIDAVSGTLNGVGQGSLALAGLPNLNTNSTSVVAINQTNSLVLSGLTGSGTYTLDFTWTSRVASGNNVLSGGDEGVVLLGLDTRSLSRIGAADDYPGTSGRTASGDGHFVTVEATVTQIVPEPSSVLLAACGGLGLAFAAWRRRRTA